jgi:hypothetical protein
MRYLFSLYKLYAKIMWLAILGLIVAIGYIWMQYGVISYNTSSGSTSTQGQVAGARKHKLSYKHHRRHRK